MLWVVAFHVFFVVVWFAGLFYLPRLFVYHAMCEDEPGNERFKVMERKLYIMTNIGAVGTAVFGFWLVFDYAYQSYAGTLWFWLKMLFVLLLYVFHGYCGRLLRDFRTGVNIRGHRFYRWVNEIPTIPLLVVVIMVIVKPF